jgi:hypothetical protein
MLAVSTPRRRADEVRTLARRGVLAATVATAGPADRTRLTGGAYDIAWPVVFNGLTQGLERRRGHLACATSVRHLADDCLDRFEDDVEAVVRDVVRSARQPIGNLEAWIASRLTAATVDGYRRRRGDLGALQRPRPPKWLVAALGDDPWLVHLSVQMLLWVGQPATAGTELWPVESWTAERAERTGDWSAGRVLVRRDIERVLTAMRGRPDWYAAYVERPLGRKEAPVSRAALAATDEPMLALVDPAELDDAYMRALAYEAVVAIRGRIARGAPAERAVTDVIQLVFGDDVTIERAPHGRDAGGERVGRLLRDADERARIVSAVLSIVGDDPDL